MQHLLHASAAGFASATYIAAWTDCLLEVERQVRGTNAMACCLITTVALSVRHNLAGSLHHCTDPCVCMLPLWQPVLLHLASACWQTQETQMCHVQSHLLE